MIDNTSKHCASRYDSSRVKSFPYHITKKILKDNVTGNHLNFSHKTIIYYVFWNESNLEISALKKEKKTKENTYFIQKRIKT